MYSNQLSNDVAVCYARVKLLAAKRQLFNQMLFGRISPEDYTDSVALIHAVMPAYSWMEDKQCSFTW